MYGARAASMEVTKLPFTVIFFPLLLLCLHVMFFLSHYVVIVTSSLEEPGKKSLLSSWVELIRKCIRNAYLGTLY